MNASEMPLRRDTPEYHEAMMAHAIELAEHGVGHVNPNPLVGAVIVKDGRIIGEGFHEQFGGPHAERQAFAHCTEDPSGADLYVTLEPCCHTGKTPPCTDIIIEKKIRRVFVGCPDPNPLVAGKGMKILRDAGIEVFSGILESECRKQNEVFLHYITEKTPFVIMKYAMTLDGKIATVSGQSRWITSEQARLAVHIDRNRYMAIMVGVGTVLSDDPMLNCRLDRPCIEYGASTDKKNRNPIRIICDSSLRTPLSSRLVSTAKEIPTIIAACCSDTSLAEPFAQAGVNVLFTAPDASGHVDLHDLMKQLGQLGIDSLILEGGGTINDAALRAGIVHKVQAYIAPKLFGGAGAKSPVGGTGISEIADAQNVHLTSVSKVGPDLLIEGRICRPAPDESEKGR